MIPFYIQFQQLETSPLVCHLGKMFHYLSKRVHVKIYGQYQAGFKGKIFLKAKQLTVMLEVYKIGSL